MPCTVLLVDDHKILRDGIRNILEKTSTFLVVGEADNGFNAVRLCRKLLPGVVVMDIGLPGMNGLEATSEVLRYCPNTRVMILTMHDDENTVVAAFRRGVRAYVLKKASSEDLLDALRIVSDGGFFLSSQVSDQLLTRIRRGDLQLKDTPDPLEGLSDREQQVLRLVADGKTSKDIAVMLELGLETVRTYRKTLMKKLGVCNIAGLTQFALASGQARLGKSDQKLNL
jgi:DNA-binding NarL/FixJ family response regulator